MRRLTGVDEASLSLTALLVLLLLPGPLDGYELVPIEVEVQCSVSTPETYKAEVAKGGILLGALTRLMVSNANFRFTYTMDLNFGPYLESVNGLAGDKDDHTYWELLVQTPGGPIIRPNVGIGCYLPKKDEKIILKFTKWDEDTFIHSDL